MSYILDALRRAESERASEKAPSLHDQPLDPLLRPDAASRSGAPWLWMIAGGGLVLAGATLWAYIIGVPASPPPSAAPPQAAISPTPAPLPAAPLTPAPAPATVAPSPEPNQGTPVVVTPYPTLPEPPAGTTPSSLAPPPQAVSHEPTPGIGQSPQAPSPPVSAHDTPVPMLTELPDTVRRSLPPLRFEGTLYSAIPSNRLLMLNGQVLHEGEMASPDLKVEHISRTSAVLDYRGTRFELSK